MKYFISAFVSLVVLVTLCAASLAVGFYSFYIPYNYFVNPEWLTANMEIVVFMPVAWYVLWFIEKYCMKFVIDLISNVTITVCSLWYNIKVSEIKNSIEYKSALKKVHSKYC